MSFTTTWGAAAIALAVAAPATAATITGVNLTAGTTSSTVQANHTDPLASGNVFVFSANAGDFVDIDINRLVAAPDLIAVLSFGEIRGVDVGSATWSDVAGSTDFYGTTFLSAQDDTEDDAFGGPWGDPRFSLTLTQTGTYTLFISSLNGGIGSPFEIVATGISAAPVSAVPLPAGGALLLGALGSVALRRRTAA